MSLSGCSSQASAVRIRPHRREFGIDLLKAVVASPNGIAAMGNCFNIATNTWHVGRRGPTDLRRSRVLCNFLPGRPDMKINYMSHHRTVGRRVIVLCVGVTLTRATPCQAPAAPRRLLLPLRPCSRFLWKPFLVAAMSLPTSTSRRDPKQRLWQCCVRNR